MIVLISGLLWIGFVCLTLLFLAGASTRDH